MHRVDRGEVVMRRHVPVERHSVSDADQQAATVPYVQRTPITERLIVWPGTPFLSRPLPYLHHRWEVCYDIIENGKVLATCSCHGFFLRRSAERYADDFA